MNQIFVNYFRIALIVSIMILVVLAIRPIIKKFSNRMTCFLWAIVMARLLIPFPIGNMTFAMPEPLENWISAKEANLQEAQSEEIHMSEMAKDIVKVRDNMIPSDFVLDDPTQDNVVKDSVYTNNVTLTNLAQDNREKDTLWKNDIIQDELVLNELGQIELGQNELGQGELLQGGVVQNVVEESPVNPNEVHNAKANESGDFVKMIVSILGVTWFLGMILFLMIGMVQYSLVAKKLKESIPYKKWGKFPVKISDMKGVPLSFGIIHRRIYVPAAFTDDSEEDCSKKQQYQMILIHEEQHLKTFDPLWKAFAFLALSIHWWNPLMWIAYCCLSQDLEMACDEAVLKRIGNEGKKEYATTLLEYASEKSGITLAASFGKSHCERRIRNILKHKQSSFLIHSLILVCVLSLGGCIAFAGLHDGMNGEGGAGNDSPKETVSGSDAYTQTVSDGDGIAKVPGENEKPVNDKVNKNGENDKWKKIYAQVLERYIEGDEGFKAKDCGFIYLRHGNVPELVITGENKEEGALIFTIKDGFATMYHTNRLDSVIFFERGVGFDEFAKGDGERWDFITGVGPEGFLYPKHYVRKDKYDHGKWIFQYFIDDEEMFGDEYNKYSLFDIANSRFYAGTGTTLNSMLDRLENRYEMDYAKAYSEWIEKKQDSLQEEMAYALIERIGGAPLLVCAGTDQYIFVSFDDGILNEYPVSASKEVYVYPRLGWIEERIREESANNDTITLSELKDGARVYQCVKDAVINGLDVTKEEYDTYIDELNQKTKWKVTSIKEQNPQIPYLSKDMILDKLKNDCHNIVTAKELEPIETMCYDKKAYVWDDDEDYVVLDDPKKGACVYGKNGGKEIILKVGDTTYPMYFDWRDDGSLIYYLEAADYDGDGMDEYLLVHEVTNAICQWTNEGYIIDIEDGKANYYRYDYLQYIDQLKAAIPDTAGLKEYFEFETTEKGLYFDYDVVRLGSFAASSLENNYNYYMGHLTGYVGYKGEGIFEITDLKYVPGDEKKDILE